MVDDKLLRLTSLSFEITLNQTFLPETRVNRNEMDGI